MIIHELRKVVSRNKKFKYVYQVIVADKIVYERRTNKEYFGCLVDANFKAHSFFEHWEGVIITSSPKSVITIALTFDGLLKLSKL